MKKTLDLTDMAVSGRVLHVRATPKAASDRVERAGDVLRVYVTAPPDKGKANEAIRKLLARGLGLPKSRLTLLRGETSRDKQFRID